MSPTTNEVGTCDSCGEPIRWGRIGSMLVPIDRYPSDQGNVVIDPKGVAMVLTGDSRLKYAGTKYLQHKVKCRAATEYPVQRVEESTGKMET